MRKTWVVWTDMLNLKVVVTGVPANLSNKQIALVLAWHHLWPIDLSDKSQAYGGWASMAQVSEGDVDRGVAIVRNQIASTDAGIRRIEWEDLWKK